MKKSWKARLIDVAIFIVVAILLIFTALCVFIVFESLVYLIFGAEALTNLALLLIAILSSIFVLAIFVFSVRE